MQRGSLEPPEGDQKGPGVGRQMQGGLNSLRPKGKIIYGFVILQVYRYVFFLVLSLHSRFV